MRTLVVVLCVLFATSARAEPDWYDGVSPAQRDEAKALFEEGRRLLYDAYFTRAADRLEASVRLWDHPATHFNLGKALLNLERPADALLHLWASMRYLGEPLQLEHVDQVASLTRYLLDNELARLVVRTDLAQPVTVGGQRVLAGRGLWEGVVRAGEVVLVSGTGQPMTLTIAPGTSVSVDVQAKLLALSHQHRIGPADLASLQQTLLGFTITYPTADERERWGGRTLPEFTWHDPGEALQPPADRLCERPKGKNLVAVCAAYREDRKALVERLRRLEVQRRAAIRQLYDMTRGGVLDALE